MSGYRPKGRRPQVPPIEFKERLPLALKNKVSGKGDRPHKVECLEEMSLVFSCLKKTNFDQSKCAAEIGTFEKCFKDYRVSLKAANDQQKTGKLVPGEAVLTARQLNTLLKRFPHPK